ncbi:MULTISPECIES: SHOCT domain-containing protein [Salinibaculum]|uniref:SHOCT domain-containing protein n=1 Tax=Salinibaculum TaxID=2732368 RepID=UPI0030D3BF0C
MVDGPVDHAILAISIIAVLLGVTMLAGGGLTALAPIFFGLLGFAYLKADFEHLRAWIGSRDESDVDEAEDALAVLRSRYASGELDHDEFERRLEDLLETETVEQAENRQQHERVRERE